MKKIKKMEVVCIIAQHVYSVREVVVLARTCRRAYSALRPRLLHMAHLARNFQPDASLYYSRDAQCTHYFAEHCRDAIEMVVTRYNYQHILTLDDCPMTWKMKAQAMADTGNPLTFKATVVRVEAERWPRTAFINDVFELSTLAGICVVYGAWSILEEKYGGSGFAPTAYARYASPLYLSADAIEEYEHCFSGDLRIWLDRICIRSADDRYFRDRAHVIKYVMDVHDFFYMGKHRLDFVTRYGTQESIDDYLEYIGHCSSFSNNRGNGRVIAMYLFVVLIALAFGMVVLK